MISQHFLSSHTGQLVQGGQVLQLPRNATGQHRKSDGKRPAGKTYQRIRFISDSSI